MPQETGIAENVARLRLDHRLTQAALAERVGMSRVTLGKIERGVVLPRAETLTALARGLGVPVRDLVIRVRPLRSVRFRARSTMYGRGQTLAEVSRWLADYAGLEAELRKRRDFQLNHLCNPQSEGDPTELAHAVREAVGLASNAPVLNICGLLEDQGVKVLLLDKKNESFFGLSVGDADGGPAVVVNVWERISVERWIFTAAHELGHILLHRPEFEPEKTEFPDETEREADAFASEFLMPESAFETEWNATRGYPLLWRVLAVKRSFRVSYKTVLRRLVETQREDTQVWRAFQRQHRDRFGKTLKRQDEPEALQKSEFAWNWGRAGEPAALTEHDFRRDRLSRLVRRAIEEGNISLSRGAEILGFPLEEMRGWARDWAG